MTPLTDILVDFSALSTLACARKYQLTCVAGLDTSSNDTNWGSAFHKFAEARNMGAEVDTMQLVMDCAKQYNLPAPDVGKLLVTAQCYENSQKLPVPIRDYENRPMVEWKFSFPYLTTDKYRVLLCGTVDLIYATDTMIVFRDYKTTAKASGLDKVETEYAMSFQVPFYLYCLQHHLACFMQPKFAALAEKGHIMGEYMMVYKSFTPPKFKLVSPIRAWARADVEAVLHPMIGRIIALNEASDLAPAEGTATGACKNCAFAAACLCHDMDRRNALLNSFPRRIYNPMTFR